LDLFYQLKNLKMKIQNTTLFLFFFLSTIFLSSCDTSNTSSPKGWTKVFVNDENGNALFGNKAELIDAVRSGYPIRIGFGGRRVEHVANADFLTISAGEEVFGQIPSILGQMPSFPPDSIKVDFRPNNKWTRIAGTNGYNSNLMTDYIKHEVVNNRSRQGSTTWYVNYNNPNIEKDVTPLWHKSSNLWENWNSSTKK